MSDPISGTGLAGGVLTGASVYGFVSGTDYGVVFGAFVRGASVMVVSHLPKASTTSSRKLMGVPMTHRTSKAFAGLATGRRRRSKEPSENESHQST
jgi:hypothetical protein